MTTRIAIALAIVLACAFAADYVFNDMSASFFLAKKIVDLIEWLAFWR